MPGRIGSYDTEKDAIINVLKDIVKINNIEEIKTWIKALINEYDKKNS